MESGIHGCGIRNPQSWNPESTAWNPESKTLLDYLTWAELLFWQLMSVHVGTTVNTCTAVMRYLGVNIAIVNSKKHGHGILSYYEHRQNYR